VFQSSPKKTLLTHTGSNPVLTAKLKTMKNFFKNVIISIAVGFLIGFTVVILLRFVEDITNIVIYNNK
jgi:NhaP-type Na+/H+ or K+/H+ antiporter